MTKPRHAREGCGWIGRGYHWGVLRGIPRPLEFFVGERTGRGARNEWDTPC